MAGKEGMEKEMSFPLFGELDSKFQRTHFWHPAKSSRFSQRKLTHFGRTRKRGAFIFVANCSSLLYMNFISLFKKSKLGDKISLNLMEFSSSSHVEFFCGL